MMMSEHTNLGRKVFAYTFAIAIGISTAFFAVFNHFYLDATKSKLAANETLHVDAITLSLSQAISSWVEDVQAISHSPTLRSYVEAPTAHSKQALGVLLKRLAEAHGHFDQLRYIDASGREVVRINYHGGKAVSAADSELQDKSRRYYFTETMSLPIGKTYLSPIDLNIENGRIEVPHKPTLRIATPIFDNQGNRRGIFIANGLADKLFAFSDRMSSNDKSVGYLLDQGGRRLRSPATERELDLSTDPGNLFGAMYPDAFGHILAKTRGTFENSKGIFVFDVVDLSTVQGTASKRPVFKVVHLVPAAEYGFRNHLQNEPFHFAAPLFSILLSGLLALFAARAVMFQREKVREQSRLSREKEEALNSITVSIVMSDVDGDIEYANPSACKLFGYELDELIGQNVRILANDKDRAEHDAYISRYEKTKKPRVIGIGRHVVAQNKTGRTFPVHLGLADVVVGGERKFIASILDLTNEDELQSQLRQSQKMEAVGQLVGGISHDFNNLLGIIVGNLDLAQRKVEADSKVHKQITTALGAAKRGADLTRRLLNFSRLTPTDSPAFYVNETLTSIQELLGKSLTSKTPISLDMEDRLPPVRADAGEFEDALVNLSINARDAMPDGGTIVIATRSKTIGDGERGQLSQLQPGDYIEISVSDSGVGISKEDQSKIFEPFFSTKEKGKGTGLGLSMVYGFLKRSRGLITVYSEEGIGTTFRMYLPAAQPEQNDDRAEQAGPSGQKRAGGDETILVVDDEPALLEVASEILTELGYKVLTAKDGTEAMNILGTETGVDLVFSDVIMPGGIGGFELAEKAREMFPNVKVCLTSGFPGNAGHEASNGRAKFEILRKPYTNIELAQAVRRALDQKESQGL